MHSFYEFFAGGGMARAGLGCGWRCLFANDFDPVKAAAYAANWGEAPVCADVATLAPRHLPGRADLAWASFPCQDLSLAGDGRGLGRPEANAPTRSGAFWPFWRLIRALGQERRAPAVVALENVAGLLTANGGDDFAALAAALARADYRFGGLLIDARRFVPQSRPRLFVLAVRRLLDVPADLTAASPIAAWTTPALRAAHARLEPRAAAAWLWWRLPEPADRPPTLAELIEDAPTGVSWDAPEACARLLSLMSPVNLAKVRAAQRAGRRAVGCVYRRTRSDGAGGRAQRAEVRFDELAGCLRTPAGGSSRQRILVVDGPAIRSRLLSPREAARLMGLPDSYLLPLRYNDAYRLAGDGVVAPVVRHLARHLIEPLLRANACAGAQIEAYATAGAIA